MKERYRKILHDLYFSTDFKPSFLYSLIVEDKFGKVSYGNEFLGTRRKFFVSDVDGVLNKKGTPSLFECYLKGNSNFGLRKNSEKLCEIARKIGEATRKGEKQEIKSSVKELEDEIKSYNLTIDEHLSSCINGAKNLKLASNLINCFYKIRKMNYKIILNSGSPQECLDFLRKNFFLN